MEDFGKYLEESMNNLKISFKPGEKVKGTICAIDSKNVFVDIKSVSEGIINREEFLDKEGNITAQVGDSIEAFYVDSRGNGINLSIKMTGNAVADHLDDAFQSGIPVEGKVTGERKGGYTVKLANRDAFCPFSQMSIGPGNPEDFIGNQYAFNITELSHNNIVVSRRKILEQERELQLAQLKGTLAVGDVLEGTVANIKDFGVFVELGGTQGFIPASELAWSKGIKAEELFKTGDKIKVSIINIDWDKERITLSFKSAHTPWEDICSKYPLGKRCTAKIVRLEPFGAFAELELGIEGLIHISNFGTGARINHPKEVVSIGDEVDVEIDRIDDEKKKISLKKCIDANVIKQQREPIKAEPNTPLNAGDVIIGSVDGIKPFGVFVRLNSEKSGLLHVSEADLPEFSQNTFKALSDKYPIGSEITVIIKEINGNKISLASKEKMDKAQREAQAKGNHKDSASNSFGSLGNVFDNLNL